MFMTSCRVNSNNIGSSKNLFKVTSSVNPFRLLVLIANSRAKAVTGCCSKGRMTTDLSNGSPGTICQCENTLKDESLQIRSGY